MDYDWKFLAFDTCDKAEQEYVSNIERKITVVTERVVAKNVGVTLSLYIARSEAITNETHQ
uniref:Bm1333 n=1 Tax=Brugia malayi TaxID=6279 RepID=A0A1I9G2M7_BRUMA|nr:Bm1333 [Brugia malayi]